MHRVVAAGVALAAPLLLAATPIVGVSSAGVPAAPVTITHGLANPRQLDLRGAGLLYVADAGSGAALATHPGGCAPGEDGTGCVGDTGDLTAIGHADTRATPGGTQLFTHLLSLADQGTGASDPAGSAGTGLDAVSLAPNGHAYGIFTYVPHNQLKGEPALVRREDGKLVEFVKGKIRIIANIGAYSLTHPNKGHAPDSDPYGVLALNREVFVADAANNTLLVVRKGKIKTLRVFPYRHGSGKDGSYDTVPTSLAVDGKGHLFVGTLGSLNPGDGKVYELNQAGKVLRVIRKLSQIDGVAVDSRGNVYVTEIFGGQSGPFNTMGDPNGDLVKITRHNVRTVTAVPLPGGVAVGGGHVYVSEFSISPTLGSVVRLS